MRSHTAVGRFGRALTVAVFIGIGVGRAQPAAEDAAVAPAAALPAVGPGYDDTPFLPGTPWRVHDNRRPHPPVIIPGSASAQARPGAPPSDAVILFDGTDFSRWQSNNAENPPVAWQIENGEMVVTKTGAIRTRDAFGSCQLHVEWCAPTPPRGESQSRGNSGVILMGRYEIQVLDSYDNPTYADGQAAAIYGQYPPLVNASRPPGEWQTYDIVFTAPVFAGSELVRPAVITLFHNGVLVQVHRELIGAVSHKRVGQYRPHPSQAPLVLQEHGSPVRFRNIWIRPLE